jgi:hypothetical protein
MMMTEILRCVSGRRVIVDDMRMRRNTAALRNIGAVTRVHPTGTDCCNSFLKETALKDLGTMPLVATVAFATAAKTITLPYHPSDGSST